MHSSEIWRRTAVVPRCSWWCTRLAGNYSECIPAVAISGWQNLVKGFRLLEGSKSAIFLCL